jgi:hypothetical protein
MTDERSDAQRWVEERGGLFVDPLLPYLAERPDGTREERAGRSHRGQAEFNLGNVYPRFTPAVRVREGY